MFFRLLAAFILVPVIELFLLLQLAAATSIWATFALVVITGVIGTTLARREGMLAWRRFHAALAEGRMPSREIQDGLMIVFAAALLLTPGLLTDTLGFLLLVPVGRDIIRRFVLSRYIGRFQVTTYYSGPQPESQSAGPSDYGDAGFSPVPGPGYTVDAEAVRRK